MKNVSVYFAIAFLAVNLSSSVRASEESRLSPWFILHYSAGVAGFTGNLSSERDSLFHDFQISFLHQSNQKIEGHLSFDVMTLSTVHTGKTFPFDSGVNLRLLNFFMIPSICYRFVDHFRSCAGIGIGTVNVNSETQRRDYGSWNYQIQAQYFLYDAWSIQALVKYVGEVEQTVAGAASQFGFYAFGIGLGWSY